MNKQWGTRLALNLLLLCMVMTPAAAQRLGAVTEAQSVVWPTISLSNSISGFSNPVFIGNAGDGTGRLFVVEKDGRIELVKNGTLSATPFLDIKTRVDSIPTERGLLSVAFPPGYGSSASKQHFYVYYTHVTDNSLGISDGTITISRFGLMPGNPDQADPGSEQVVLMVPHSEFSNHNGGQLQFNPADGDLYAGMGDGGGGGDSLGNAENGLSLLAKISRIDVESGSPTTYTVPAGNPFVGNSAFRPEIWAWGLRNPWRFSFDRYNGDLYIGDVGQNCYEEVDYQPGSSHGGETYGWHLDEGMHGYNSSCTSPPPSYISSYGTGTTTYSLTAPVLDYDHSNGCSITGGYVSRGLTYPRLQGIYFYADYCSGHIWGLQRNGNTWTSQQLLASPYKINSFGEDEAGNLWVTDPDNGRIWLIVDSQPSKRSLNAGWNLISLPGAASTPLRTALAGLPWQKAFYYDSASSTWTQVSSSQPTYAQTLSTLDRTQGIWVYLAGPGTLNSPALPLAPNSIILHHGWNLVGLPRHNNLAFSTAGFPASVDQVLYYFYGGWVTATPSTDAPLYVGLGLWVHNNGGDVSWTVTD